MFFDKELDKISVSQECFDYIEVEFSKEKHALAYFSTIFICPRVVFVFIFSFSSVLCFCSLNRPYQDNCTRLSVKGKEIYLGMTDMVTIGVLIKQQSVLTVLITFIRKHFYSKGGGFFSTEIHFSNSSSNTLKSSFVIGLQINYLRICKIFLSKSLYTHILYSHCTTLK